MTHQAGTDRTAELEARIAELERKTSWRKTMNEGRSGLEAAFWALTHTVFPEDARRHLKAATREQLMAARVYLDRWIAQLDEEDAAKAEAEQQHEKIEIE